MTEILKIYNDDGSVMDWMPYTTDEMCYGGRSGLIGEMCGGCCHCIALQCYHSGVRCEIDEEENLDFLDTYKKLMTDSPNSV